uniref:Phosphatidic acid phosphatase type 2/haloperoxidase domain-containing protein n=1 Tax=Globisporangium ultimum (strain ATCC 200006 / CBS 805.95 / DAOM BR144) TaxID=431595 RepID=K3WB16_GLOUD
MNVDAHPLLQWDLQVVAWFVQKKAECPWVAKCVHATTSRYRTQDMSLVLWLIFIVMIRDFGLPYVWICVGNLLGVLLLQYVAQIGRPIDLDSSLYEHQYTDPDTNGFPCVDSHMSVVVLLPVIMHVESPVVQSSLALLLLYLGMTKLFVATRFVSQVVGSWLTGLAGILVGNHGHAVLKTYKLSRGYKYEEKAQKLELSLRTGAIVVLIVFLMYVVGTWIENNESCLLGVPKQDYVDVITNILSSDAPTPTTTSSSADSGTPPGAAVHQFPATKPARDTRRRYASQDPQDDEESEDAVVGKRDSFYFLMKAMKAREGRRL